MASPPYPAQQDSWVTSLANVWAYNFNPSTMVSDDLYESPGIEVDQGLHPSLELLVHDDGSVQSVSKEQRPLTLFN
jgi:hypothetical protein